MTAEGVAMEGSKFKLSADLLPAEALERSKIGNKFEKVKCAKDPSLVFDEVGVCSRDHGIVGVVGQIGRGWYTYASRTRSTGTILQQYNSANAKVACRSV